MTVADADARLKKLQFRAWRRGFREADLILGPFADARLSGFSPEELDAFERLLEAPDQDLYGWIIGRTPPPPALDGPVLRAVMAFREQAHLGRPLEERGA